MGRIAAEEAAAQLGISRPSVYELIKRYRAGNGLVTDLAAGQSGGGKGKKRIGVELDAIITEVVEALYLTRQRRSEAVIVREMHCLALGGVDQMSAAGKMTMQVIAAVAEFERDLLIERTMSGLSRAKAAGKRFGRPPILDAEERVAVLKMLDAGDTIAGVAREFKTTLQTILLVRDAAG